jgi:exopolysaccharide biosynthesis protein
MNLDGGGSSALIYDDEYKVGPGRDIVNAIVFSE